MTTAMLTFSEQTHSTGVSEECNDCQDPHVCVSLDQHPGRMPRFELLLRSHQGQPPQGDGSIERPWRTAEEVLRDDFGGFQQRTPSFNCWWFADGVELVQRSATLRRKPPWRWPTS